MNPQWVHEVFACVVINDFQMIFTGNIKVLTPVQIEALELEQNSCFLSDGLRQTIRSSTDKL